MLDLRALIDGTGSTTAANLSTIATNDGAVLAGVPLGSAATLAYISFDQLVAGTPFKTLKVNSLDLPDPQNGYDLGVTDEYAPDAVIRKLMLKYASGSVVPNYSQTAAAKLCAGLHWYYPNVGGTTVPPPNQLRPLAYTTTFGGALTAQAWGSQAFSPSSIPVGQYAILGAAVGSITKRALLRFNHPSWGLYRPGFYVTEQGMTTTLAGAMNELGIPEEFRLPTQFVRLSQHIGTPECPVFPVTNTSTGLNFEILSNTADTPKVTLYLHKVG